MTAPILEFDEARTLVYRAAAAGWRPDLGTLHVSREAYDFGTHWRMIVGAAEDIVDGDSDYRIMDAPVFVVSKATGHVNVLPWHADPLLTASGPVPPRQPG